MLIRIGEFDITECWDGVFYKKLSRYYSWRFIPETAWIVQTEEPSVCLWMLREAVARGPADLAGAAELCWSNRPV